MKPVVEEGSAASRLETTGPRDHDWIMAQAESLKARGETSPRFAHDPVNQPQIHTWLEAIGDQNPVYRDTAEAAEIHGGPVAPPAMAQVWTMHGLGLPDGHPGGDARAHDPLHQMMMVMDEAGFTSVLGTNCDQTYDRYLRPGEQVSVTTRLESVVGPKKTGVGEGYFVTTRSVWRVGDEQVATMLFRVLKYRPVSGPRAGAAASSPPLASLGGPGPATPARGPVRPVRNRDTEFFWEGTAAGELRIQSCNACGLLRHPPGPMCPSCHAADRGYVVSPGRGRIYSFVTHHAPQIPGKALPLLLAVIELDEGVRMVGEVRGAPDGEVEVGTPVQVGLDRIDDDLTLPIWHVVDGSDA